MSNEILDALSQITREKSVDRALLIETLEQGLASAVRKKHGATAEVDVKFTPESDLTGPLRQVAFNRDHASTKYFVELVCSRRSSGTTRKAASSRSPLSR